MFDRNQIFSSERMTRRVPVLRGLWMSLVLLGSLIELTAQLPPEIMADRYLLQAEKRMLEKDPGGALEMLEKIVALEEEHEITLPLEFHYKYAQVAFSAEFVRTAQESVKKYLMVAGREGEFYREALELSIKMGAITQLPPEILVDQYQLQAEQLMTQEDHRGALVSLQKILALQEEYGLTLPDAFHFKYAQVAFLAGRLAAVLESLNQYLVADGRGGEYYHEALQLLDSAERIQPVLDQYRDSVYQLMAESDHEAALDLMDQILDLKKEHDFALPKGFRSKYAEARIAVAEPKCVRETQESECWMELQNQSECYVWYPRLSNTWYFRKPVETVTWTAECYGGLAQGVGFLFWVSDSGKTTLETRGQLQEGKAHGTWSEQWGTTSWRGPYLEGKKHGYWESDHSKGPFVEDRRHGDWVEDWGRKKGPYVEGKRHGDWIIREPVYGNVGGGPYVEGKKHGYWVEHGIYDKDEGPYAEGLRHGDWTITSYIFRDADEPYQGPTNISHGSYEAGKRTGIWKSEMLWREPILGVRQCLTKKKVPYVDGEIHGEVIERWSSCDCYREVYEGGNRLSSKKVRKKTCRRELD